MNNLPTAAAANIFELVGTIPGKQTVAVEGDTMTIEILWGIGIANLLTTVAVFTLYRGEDLAPDAESPEYAWHPATYWARGGEFRATEHEGLTFHKGAPVAANVPAMAEIARLLEIQAQY